MATTHSQTQNDAVVRRNLLALKKRVYDIKFDLSGTDYIPNVKIGSGAYGVVCSATHKKSKDNVAIKKTPNVFVHPDLAMRTYREIKILRHFKHDNIISIREILKPNTPDFRDVYLVLDLMESDLHQIIHTNDPLSDEHVMYFLYQILRGLKYVHSANVIHRDLKPSNLLVNSNCELKIGDFGMARGIASCPDGQTSYSMTAYVATRWYRAPELMMLHKKYSTSVDIWSVGCIFAEMLGRKQLFPGKDINHQWRLITAILGTPSTEFFKTNGDLTRDGLDLGPKKPIPFKTLYPTAPKKALDLLSKMLEFVPGDRLTVEKALQHPYLSNYHDPDDEPVCIPAFNFDFEKEGGADIKKSILREIEDMHRLNFSNITYNLQMVPKEEFVKNTPPQSRENSASLISGTEKVIRELQELAKQQAPSVSSVDNSQQQNTGLNDKQEPKNQEVPNVDTTKTTDDVEMLSAKTLALKISNEEEASNLENGDHQVSSPTNIPLKVDASKTTDDVEMLSAKTHSMKIESQAGVLKQDASRRQLDGETAGDITVLSVVPPKDGGTSDVKMHSAKRDDNMGLQPAVVVAKDKTTAPSKPLDAKALIKAAILNGRKARSMSESGENVKPRVTALQRQKQREDKRKKKHERAMMKKKKKGETDNKESLTLSEADRCMLERWKNMQTKTEKKLSEGQADNVLRSSHGSLSVPNTSSQVGLPTSTMSRTGIGVVTQVTNGCTSTIGPAQIGNINQTSGRVNHTLLHNNTAMTVIADRGIEKGKHPSGQIGINTRVPPQIVGQQQLISSSLNPVGLQVTNSQPVKTLSQPNVGVGVITHPITIISDQNNSQSVTKIPQTLTTSTIGGMFHPAQGPNHQISGLVPQPEGTAQPLGLRVQTLVGPPSVLTSSGPSHTPPQIGIPTASLTHSGLTNSRLSPWEENVTNIVCENPQGSHVPFVGHATHPTLALSPSQLLPSYSGIDVESTDQSLVTLPEGWLCTQPTSHTERPTTEVVQSETFSSTDTPYPVIDINLSDSVPPRLANLVVSSDTTSLVNQQKVNPNKDGVGDISLGVWLAKANSPQPIFSSQDQTISIPFAELQGLSPLRNLRTNRPTPEHLNLSSQQKLFQRPQVDDLNLVHTPKGRGAGYGVGLDLDLLLRETVPMEDSDDRNSEIDPLSATLLADWQELSNMNPHDLEALEREIEMGFSSPVINT